MLGRNMNMNVFFWRCKMISFFKRNLFLVGLIVFGGHLFPQEVLCQSLPKSKENSTSFTDLLKSSPLSSKSQSEKLDCIEKFTDKYSYGSVGVGFECEEGSIVCLSHYHAMANKCWTDPATKQRYLIRYFCAAKGPAPVALEKLKCPNGCRHNDSDISAVCVE